MTVQIDLDALLAAAPSPYMLLDTELRFVWANDAYLKAIGRSREDILGRVLSEAFPVPAESDSDKMLNASFRKVLSTGRNDHLSWIPYPIETPDGQIEERYWSATHTPILDAEGRVEYILQNTIDVTELYHSKQGETV